MSSTQKYPFSSTHNIEMQTHTHTLRKIYVLLFHKQLRAREEKNNISAKIS